MAREFEIISNPQFHNLHIFLVHMFSRAPHIHQELEIGCVLQGKASLRGDGRSFDLSVTDGYLINPLEAHEFFTAGDGAIILAIQISPMLFGSFFPDLPMLRFHESTDLRKAIGQSEAYEDLFRRCVALAEQYIRRPRHYEYDCFAMSADLIARLIRLLPEDAISKEAWASARRRMERFLPILNDIDENYRQKLLLTEIAKKEGLTMTYLSHLFRETLDMSFQEYLMKKRFEYARAMILGSRKSLLEISLESGFSDSRYMIRMFEKEFGCTPAVYRKTHDTGSTPLRDESGNIQHILEGSEALECLFSCPLCRTVCDAH